MLAFEPGSYAATNFLSRRSPLSSRDSNSCALPSATPSIYASQKLFARISSGQMTENRNPLANTQSRRVQEPRRHESKFAPLLRRRDDRDARRSAYLNNARRAGDDRMFEARMEQSWRREWLDEEKEWAAKMESEHAEELPMDGEEDLAVWEDTDEQTGRSNSQDFDMMEDEEQPPSDEEDAFQQFLWSQTSSSDEPQLPTFDRQTHYQTGSDGGTQTFWSDDDNFENSLIQAAMRIEQHVRPNTGSGDTEQADADMTT